MPLIVSGPNLDQTPKRFEGEGKTESKKETRKQVDRGVAEQEIFFFTVSNS
jgi:hypothetical protein